MKMTSLKVLRVTVMLLSATQVAGCGIGYYWQAAAGHLKLMRERRPLPEVIADPATGPEIRRKLEIAREVVGYAHRVLLLPDNGSYRSYVEIDREYVVWNVFAAPEFSFEPRTWCFPVAGCVSYRGYFDASRARDYAERLSRQGDDVFVGGVTAYSTLGRFDDPLLSTIIELPSYQIAGLIFHELAHQRVYVKGDSQFNEGFASFVEREGLHRWLRSINDEASLRSARLALDRLGQAQDLLMQSGRIWTNFTPGTSVTPKNVQQKEKFWPPCVNPMTTCVWAGVVRPILTTGSIAGSTTRALRRCQFMTMMCRLLASSWKAWAGT